MLEFEWDLNKELLNIAKHIQYASLEVANGENLGNCMKQPKLKNLILNHKATSEIRTNISKTKKIKITINIDQNSLETLRNMATQSGMPYQNLLNQILKEGLNKKETENTRLDRLEKELALIKKKIAA